MKYITILFAITFSYSITKAKDINNEIDQCFSFANDDPAYSCDVEQ